MNKDVAFGTSENVEFEALDPRGKIEAVPISLPSARISDLDGKTIGLYSNSKPGMDNPYTVFEEILIQKYPSVKVKSVQSAFLIRDEDADTLAKEV